MQTVLRLCIVALLCSIALAAVSNCTASTYYQQSSIAGCSFGQDCFDDMCECLSSRNALVINCMRAQTASCPKRTRCIGKNMLCLNNNAEKYLNNGNCSAWATPIHLATLTLLSTNNYNASDLYKQCVNMACLYNNDSHNPKACNSTADQICSWAAPMSFTTTITIKGTFTDTFVTGSPSMRATVYYEQLQELLEKDLKALFGSSVATEIISANSTAIVASLAMPRGQDLNLVYTMMANTNWLGNFKTLVGGTITGVTASTLPTTTAAPTTTRPPNTTAAVNTTRPPTTRSSASRSALSLIALLAMLVFPLLM